MDRRDFAKVFTMLSKVYEWFDATDTTKIDIWYKFFEDDDYTAVMTAAQKWICDHPKAPTIADLRMEIGRITHEGILPVEEAWGHVQRAIREGAGYAYIEKDKERAIINSIPEPARSVASRIGFREMAMEDETAAGVSRGQFIKLYNAAVQRMETERARPAALAQLLESKELKQIGA